VCRLDLEGVVAKWKQGTYLKARLTGRAGSS
jgi:hypothetical protein